MQHEAQVSAVHSVASSSKPGKSPTPDNQPPHVPPLLQLPTELQLLIMSSLHLHDLLALCRTCTQLRDVANLSKDLLHHYSVCRIRWMPVQELLRPCADCSIPQRRGRFRLLQRGNRRLGVPAQRHIVCWNCEDYRWWTDRKPELTENRGWYVPLRRLYDEDDETETERTCAGCLDAHYLEFFETIHSDSGMGKHSRLGIMCYQCRTAAGEVVQLNGKELNLL
jgi:hypothetical protein